MGFFFLHTGRPTLDSGLLAIIKLCTALSMQDPVFELPAERNEKTAVQQFQKVEMGEGEEMQRLRDVPISMFFNSTTGLSFYSISDID